MVKMNCQLLIFIIYLSFNDITARYYERQADQEPEIDLDYLRYIMYGEPDSESGEKVAEWHEDDDINPEELGNYAEGDILFSKAIPQNGLASLSKRWPKKQIPYYITNDFNYYAREKIMSAINDFHKYTCVRFIPYSNENVYIRITSKNKGCYSSVGYTGYSYDVNFQQPGCIYNKGTILHELMHAMGFVHEQSRDDRDNYISIIYNNILLKQRHNFQKFRKGYLTNFGIPYDYDSVLHYSSKAFSTNNNATIIPKGNKNTKIGQRLKLSSSDIEKINRMYLCFGRTASYANTTEKFPNEGTRQAETFDYSNTNTTLGRSSAYILIKSKIRNDTFTSEFNNRRPDFKLNFQGNKFETGHFNNKFNYQNNNHGNEHFNYRYNFQNNSLGGRSFNYVRNSGNYINATVYSHYINNQKKDNYQPEYSNYQTTSQKNTFDTSYPNYNSKSQENKIESE